MNIIKRVQLNIFRQKFRSALLLILVILIGTFIASSFIIDQSVRNVTDHLRRSIPAIVSIVGIENEDEIDTAFPMLSREIIHYIGALSYVEHYDYSINYHAWGNYQEYILAGLDMGDAREFYEFRLFGVSSPEIIFIESGLYELYVGRHFTHSEVQGQNESNIAPIIVSKQFAQLNQLWLGSVMILYHDYFIQPYPMPIEPLEITHFEQLLNHPYNNWGNFYYYFEVVGIFNFVRELPTLYWETLNDERIDASLYFELLNHQSMINLFFTPNWRVYDMRLAGFEEALLWQQVFDVSLIQNAPTGIDPRERFTQRFDPYWVLSDIEKMDSFMEEVNEILISYGLETQNLSGTFGTAVAASNSLSAIARTFMFIASGGMVLVLTLLLLFYTQGKRREIGIYLALGEKKRNIIALVLSEVLLVSIIGLIVAFLLAVGISPIISSNMFHDQLVVNERDPFHFPDMIELVGFGQEMTIEEMMAAFEISFDGTVVIQFFLVGIGIVALSTVVPVIYITELKPRDILAQAQIK